MKVKNKNIEGFLIGLTLGLILVASSWSLLGKNWGYTHDYLHANRIGEIARGLMAGEWPPIWTQNFGYGYGMPMFEFYAPLPYLVGGILELCGLPIMIIMRILFLLTNVGVLLGGYLLGKKLFNDKWAGVAVASVMTLAPYRAVDLFVRGALSESWAIMALPWIMWGIVEIIAPQEVDKKSKKTMGIIAFVLGLVVLMLSHNLTIITSLPLIGLWTIGVWFSYWWGDPNNRSRMDKWWLGALKLAGWGLLAVGLVSFYLIPAFLEKDLTKVAMMTINDYFDTSLHFVSIKQFLILNWGWGGSGWGPDDGMSFFLGYNLILLAIGMVISIIWGIKKWWQMQFKMINNSSQALKKDTKNEIKNDLKKIEKNKKNIFKKQKLIFSKISAQLILLLTISLITIISLIMCVDESLIIWKNISLLDFLQFPWRYLAVTVIFLGLWAGLAANWTNVILRNLFYGLVILLSLAQAQLFSFNPHLAGEDYYYTDPTLIRTTASGVIWDYLPADFVIKTEPVFSLIDSEDQKWLKVIVDEPMTKILESDLILEENNEEVTERWVSLNLADYPEWKLWIDNEEMPMNIGQDEEGQVKILVPVGKHELKIKLMPTPVRKWANIISLIAITITLTLIIKNIWDKKIKYRDGNDK